MSFPLSGPGPRFAAPPAAFAAGPPAAFAAAPSAAFAAFAAAADDPFDRTPLVLALLEEVPEFGPIYWDLVRAGDDDPGEPVVLLELADFVAEHLGTAEREISTILRISAVVEACLASLEGDEVGRELIGCAFFDSLSPENRRRFAPWLGPHARALLDSLDMASGVGWEDGENEDFGEQ